jgi:predicted O-methyltransferase YrrM
MTMQILQVESELDRMRALYVERKPKRVLEIGVWHGGTLREWLLNAVVGAKVVAVDLHHPNSQIYDRWRKAATDLVTVYGNSQKLSVIESVREHGPYDWVFIDGDHSAEGVRKDVFNYLPTVARGGVLLLHDIKAPDDQVEFYPPGVEFGRLAGIYETDRFISNEPSDVSHGIGVVYL